MFTNFSIQRSLTFAIGSLVVTGMVIIIAFSVTMQRRTLEAREERLNALFRNLSGAQRASLDHIGANVGNQVTGELEAIKDQQSRANLEHQHERARQLARLVASFVSPYLAGNDDARIDDVCRSAVYDSDVGVVVVENTDGLYYGGYYFADHPGLMRRLGGDGSSLPFGADRVARALTENHGGTLFEETADIPDPNDITRVIGRVRLIVLNDRLEKDARELSERADALRERVLASLIQESDSLAANQNALLDETLAIMSQDDQRDNGRMVRWLAGIILLVLVAAIAAIFILSKRLLGPLAEATRFASALGAGDLTRRLEPGRQHDARMLISALNSMADALEQRGEETRAVIAELREVLGRVGGAAASLDGGAKAIADSGQGFLSGISDLRLSLTELASTMEQMERHSDTNANNAQQVTAMSASAMDMAQIGQTEMGQMLESISAVTAIYESLGNMVKTIDGIAFQTNMLSLNAAVEAARAGKAGRGFSVVAEEVRTLANNSARKAAEAKAEMEKAEAQMRAMETHAGATARALTGIAESTREVASSLATVADASREQLQGVKTANISMERIYRVAKSGMDDAQAIARTTAMLSDMAGQLKAMLERSAYLESLAAASARPERPAPPPLPSRAEPPRLFLSDPGSPAAGAE